MSFSGVAYQIYNHVKGTKDATNILPFMRNFIKGYERHIHMGI